jgi:hypothetical protein
MAPPCQAVPVVQTAGRIVEDRHKVTCTRADHRLLVLLSQRWGCEAGRTPSTHSALASNIVWLTATPATLWLTVPGHTGLHQPTLGDTQ